VWGVISLLLSFGFGGWLTARSAAVRGSDNGLLNGFMVAGVGIPVLLFVLGSASALAAHAAIAHDRENGDRSRGDIGAARTASAVMPPNSANGATGGTMDTGNNGSANQDRERTTEDNRRDAARTAWGTLAALVLAIGAASVAGLVGAKDDGRHHRHTSGGTGSRTGASMGTDRGDTIVAG